MPAKLIETARPFLPKPQKDGPPESVRKGRPSFILGLPTNRELRPHCVQTVWMLSARLVFGKGRAFDYIGDGGHELFSPAKIKMESDSERIFQRELSRNVVGNM